MDASDHSATLSDKHERVRDALQQIVDEWDEEGALSLKAYRAAEAALAAAGDPEMPPASPSKAGEKTSGAEHFGIIDPDYARVFTIARCLAWQEGYALVMHGSFTRDLDLLAVPWRVEACEPEHLMRRIAGAAELRPTADEPGQKPHGRLAWTLLFEGFDDPRFVDLSIMPRMGAERVRHVKSGSEYEVLGEAEAQVSGSDSRITESRDWLTDAVILEDGDKLMVYRGMDGRLWCRPTDEFRDGRFVPAPPASSGQGGR